ncbi:hypothetical protein EJB05_50223, partial [Eragrostis curvula]
MDEAAASAALVLAYACEGSLCTGAAQLRMLADEVARAADDVGVPCPKLLDAVDTLLGAVNASRRTADLGKAAAALETEAAGRRGHLVLSAASVTGACRARGPPNLANVLTACDKLWYAASGAGVARDAFAAARGALADEGANDAARALAIADLIRAAADLQKEAGARLTLLARVAAELARACQDYQRVADAVPVVLQAAEAAQKKQEERRSRTAAGAEASSCAWWPWGRRVRRVPDMEMALLLTQPPEPASTSTPAEEQQSKVREAMAEKTSGSHGPHGYALYGSLALLPGFGSKEVLTGFGNYKELFTWVFCSWWSAVAMGVASSIFPRTPFDVAVAHVTSRIGMMGINILVVLYTCWLLGTAQGYILYTLNTTMVEVAIEKAQGQEKEELITHLDSLHSIL